MQKFLALLMLAAALLSLSACGDGPDTAAEPFPPTVYDGTGGNNGTGGIGSPAPENNPGGETRNTGGTEAPGTPYDRMVENGRIRDTDGILSDGENPRS